MAWYVVSYDLRKEPTSESWKRIGDALRTAYDWCTPLYSFWIIETGLTPSSVIQTLLNVGVIDDNDGIVVLEITGKGDFRRVKDGDCADWLNTHISRS